MSTVSLLTATMAGTPSFRWAISALTVRWTFRISILVRRLGRGRRVALRHDRGHDDQQHHSHSDNRHGSSHNDIELLAGFAASALDRG